MDNRDRNRDLDRDENDLENPLGISGTPVTPDAPEHLRASNDPEEAQRRRKRGLSADNDEDRSSGMDDVNLNHKGATAIDIGADRGTK
jgi:hypothetical protein